MVTFRNAFAAASFFAVTLTPAFANVIHFTGQIVEDPCNITPDTHRLSVSCPQSNKVPVQQVSYKEALVGNVSAADRATISMKYINPQKSLAIVQVEYR